MKVTITPEVTSRGVNRAVMKQLVTLYKETHLAKRLPAYDGRKSLYTAGPLPFTAKEFKISLVDEEEGPGGNRSFPITFLEVPSPMFSHELVYIVTMFLIEYYGFCS